MRISVGQKNTNAVARLDTLCERYGVVVDMPREMGEVEHGDPVNLMDITAPYIRPQLETRYRGSVGTQVRAGRIDATRGYPRTETRGTGGNFGLYETYRDSESMIYDATTSITELVASAVPKLQMPKRVRRSQQAQLEQWVASQNSAIANFQCLDGGWVRHVEEVMTSVWAGFQVSEPRFKKLKSGQWVWCGAQPRIQSTVDSWEICDDTLLGVRFRAYGSTPHSKSGYFLPALDPCGTPINNHILLTRLGGYGLNFEGTPPTRPSLHWVKFKRLIAQIVPLAVEKYGVPYTYLRADPSFMTALANGSIADVPDLTEAYHAFVEMRAQDAPVAVFGDGVIAETTAPPGAMPDLQTWISYCDSMISYPFSSEGNLLGLQSAVGSYAQAEVKERRYLRSAPAYQRMMTEPVNETIIKPLCRWMFGEMDEYPTLELSSSNLTDNSGWIADARALFGPNVPVDQWPAEWRDIAYEKMGVHSNTVEVIDD